MNVNINVQKTIRYENYIHEQTEAENSAQSQGRMRRERDLLAIR